jgi:hypothetical protein
LSELPLINKNLAQSLDTSPKVKSPFDENYFVNTPSSILGTAALKGRYNIHKM